MTAAEANTPSPSLLQRPTFQHVNSCASDIPLLKDTASDPIKHLPSLTTLATTVTNVTDIEKLQEQEPVVAKSHKRSWSFWLVFISLCVCCFLSAMELTSTSTALPTIVEELSKGKEEDPDGGGFVWVGSAYALAGTAILPWTGGLAQIFGRRPILIMGILCFIAGSTICGAAINLPMLILGRTIQGLGDGIITSLAEIVVADLVPLAERGFYQGIIGAVWAVASSIGPPLGGLFASQGIWRWLFYMNVPISVVALFLVGFFMKMKVPLDDFRTKMRRMDWFGNIICIGSMTALTVGMTIAGVDIPWISAAVLCPVILGVLGLLGFFLYEFKIPKEPTVPPVLFQNRTSITAYTSALLHGIVSMAVIWIWPTYFQACQGTTPFVSGLRSLPLALTIAPSAIAIAIMVDMTQQYLASVWVGWLLTLIGVSLMTSLKAHSRAPLWIFVQIPTGIGLGILFSVLYFPLLAPLSPSLCAHALALYTFLASIGGTIGIVLSSTVFENVLDKNIPLEFTEFLGGGHRSSSYSSIHKIKDLAEPLRREVRRSFATSLRIVWISLIPFACIGLLSSLAMKALPLHKEKDEDFALQDQNALVKKQSNTSSTPFQSVSHEMQDLPVLLQESDLATGVSTSRASLSVATESGNVTPTNRKYLSNQ